MLSASARSLSRTMTPFAKEFSAEQRAAIVEHALQPGSSAAAAHRAANAGELPCGKVAISYTYTAQLVAAEREHRNGRRARKIAEKGAKVACDLLVGEMLNVAEREARQLKNKPSNQPVDTERLRRLARAVREIRAAADAAGEAPSRKSAAANGETGEEKAQSLLEQVAASMDAGPSSGDLPAAVDGEQTIAAPGTPGEDVVEPSQNDGHEEAVRSSASDADVLPLVGV